MLKFNLKKTLHVKEPSDFYEFLQKYVPKKKKRCETNEVTFEEHSKRKDSSSVAEKFLINNERQHTGEESWYKLGTIRVKISAPPLLRRRKFP